MLSIENPPPRDPPCPSSQISQLKNSTDSSGSDDDDKASDNLHLVDLFKSEHPLPKFSIRDYVFNTRSNDIENNWPFSEENLQLCLKHGVTQVLPPFQSPDTLRKPSLGSCSCDTILSEKGNLCNSKGEPYAQNQNDHGLFVDSDSTGCNPNIAADRLDTNPSGSEGVKEFPSRTCSEIDSVPTNRCPEFEADILPELSAAKPKVVNPVAARSQAQAKKCRLVVKLANSANPSTKEDGSGSGNNFMVFEAMASKVCPVCKTFSSSSNTTLNAHIDQCLSGESTTKWSSNSKVIKHRIKPRKIKSMVEIYETALHCTLEELDRRNGTNWASNSIFPAQAIEASSAADQKKQGVSSPEETPDEGAVYIDANGTKVRILSKSSDPSILSKVADGPPPPKKLVTRDKVSKFLLHKKNKQNQVQKRQHKQPMKKISTSRPNRTSSSSSSEMNYNQDRNLSGEESFEEACTATPHFTAQDGVKINRPDMIRGWVGSKRTELTRKSNGNGRDDNQFLGNCDSRELSVENNSFSVVKGSRGRQATNSCGNSLSSSPGSSKQTDKSSYAPRGDQSMELPSVRKRTRIASEESQVSLDRDKSQAVLGFPDHSNKQLRKDRPSNREDCESMVSKRKVRMYTGQNRNADIPATDPKNSSAHNTHSSKDRMSSSLRNRLSSGPNSKLNFKRKHSAYKKSGVCLSESNEEAVAPLDREHLEQNDDYGCDRMRRTSDMVSVERTRMLKTRRSEGESMISGEESRALKTSLSVSASYPYDAEDHDGSFMLGSVSGSRSDDVESAGKNIHASEEDLDMEPPPSEDAMGAAFMDFRNSMDTQFHQLDSSSDGHRDMEQYSEAYKETRHFEDEAPTCSADPVLNDGQEMFCAAEVPEDMNVAGELGSSGMHGNYFAEVDPIPIPGPPGSFLPSPGHMDSEDLPGNSSLTSSRIQSSDDRQELVDQSSDSPLSALSTISNSTLARSDSKSSGTLLVGGSPAPDGCITAANGSSTVENSSPVLEDNNAGAGRTILDKLKMNLASNEKVVYRFKDQPCCCSRKEGFSQTVPLNYQESQLLRRRTSMLVETVTVTATGKEMTCDSVTRLDSIRSETSSVSPGDAAAAGIKSPMGHIQRIAAADSHVKFPGRDGVEPSSPPTPNPVLRLMGKNLMVVNNDESVSSQIKPSQFSSIIGHTSPHVLPVPGVSVGNAQNGSFRNMVSQAPYSLERAERSNAAMQQSEWSDGYSCHKNARTSQARPLMSPSMLSSRGAVGGLVGSLMHHEYVTGYSFPTEQRQGLNRMMGPSAKSEVDELGRSPSLRWRNAANTTANAVKEIIVIDDAPENELDSVPATTHTQGMESLPSAGKSAAMSSVSGSGSRHAASHFYGYPQYDPVDASFWMPSSSNNVANVSPAKWNWTPEGSSVLHPSPLIASSSPAAQPRPKFYTYSNFK